MCVYIKSFCVVTCVRICIDTLELIELIQFLKMRRKKIDLAPEKVNYLMAYGQNEGKKKCIIKQIKATSKGGLVKK